MGDIFCWNLNIVREETFIKQLIHKAILVSNFYYFIIDSFFLN